MGLAKSFSQISRVGRTALAASLLASTLFAAACGRSESKADAAGGGDATKGGRGRGAGPQPEAPPVAATTATAVAREGPSYLQATGSLTAEETRSAAPPT